MQKTCTTSKSMLTRRQLLKGMAATALYSVLNLPLAATGKSLAAIPVIMFHKVDDTPRYPEDMASGQLEDLLDAVWGMGFRPVNISDILDGRVDAVVQAGCMPLGITADDAHRSILFSARTHPEQRNARSFVDIFMHSVQPYRCEARATLFIGAVGDDRVSKEPEGYFGSHLPLAQAMDMVADLPGIDFGFHTRTHTRMKNMDAAQTRALLEDQMQDFRQQGVLERVQPVLAYPYGIPPTLQGIEELQKMGFKGAVEAFPGVHESRYASIPQCLYENRLLTDPFHLPRVCIGAYTYAEHGLPAASYTEIMPLDDFNKDVLAPGNLYVSKGKDQK